MNQSFNVQQQRPADDTPEWPEFFRSEVEVFWQQQVNAKYFTAFDGIKLHFAYYKQSATAPLVVIAPGRIESALKYQELFWELAQQGFSVAALDHRGQGLSARLTHNPHQGHVEDFNDFVRDFADFTDQLATLFGSVPKTLFSHSMGGTIATIYCATYQHPYRKLILSAPMFSIETGKVPYWLARAVVAAGAWINRYLSKPWYFFCMGDYQKVPFEDNVLTHSKQRYDTFRSVYDNVTDVQLGGPTFNWLYEAISAAMNAQKLANNITIPVLLFQAGNDKVVSASGQKKVAAMITRNPFRFETIEGAHHELMMETDKFRQPVLNAIIEETRELITA
ncbi:MULTISPECIES: alpha/beta hydrolase [Idiomarina]|uniref:alpha/beta hydrolase n=1 Tax=Idiomarina TaxID=135575 RepID=UPI000C5D248E|nr:MULTISPECIES: alpha/beta hydrolase [Idiomarina]MBP58211.1 lysophospholipase [Idiomarina sp.]|tara:strand:- start:1143 stop:2150 length:1008 start_codon:yes stop_codon:yes gene_type:complete